MVVFPNAKINLGLSVLKKRDDGFHDIESILYPIPLNDALELIVAPDNKFTFSVSGLEIPGNKNTNLCLMVWELLQHDFGLPAIKAHLHKAIPMGAGLGGGSADAAFMVRLINQVFRLNLSVGKMEDYARQLGSDCAFFINNTPAFAYGRGDQLKPVEVDLSGYFLVLIKPDVHINTAEAYQGIKPSFPEFSLSEIGKLPVEVWKDKMKNDFEKSVFHAHPVLGDIKKQLYQSGAVYASMTGSGSAVYGLFKENVDLQFHINNHFYWSGWL
jgi:4-diphosphocytidyl-2-C-methyl-D-erythritol kinase